MNNPLFTKEYLAFIKQTGVKDLTNSQHQFAEFLLKEDNAKELNKIGDLESVFKKVRTYIKSNNNEFKSNSKNMSCNT